MSEELKKLISDLAADLKETVHKIESGPRLTQSHYGKYMSVLSMAKSQGQKKIMALALLKAGANPTGIKSALQFV